MVQTGEQGTVAPQVLVVDDALINLKLLTEILLSRGYRVRPASSGDLALKTTAAIAPDLILLDVKMPGMDGYEVCRRLKSDEKTRGIPVIFISALDEAADKLKGFDAGGVDYIVKPFHAAEVLARVETHLTLRRLQKQLEIQNIRLQEEITERVHGEEILRQTNDYLEYVLENSPDAIAIVDADGCIIKWNRMATEIFGFTFEEIRGKPFHGLYSDTEELEKTLAVLRSAGSVRQRETCLRRSTSGVLGDAGLVPVELSLSLLKDPRGGTLGSVAVARDLSESRKMVAALRSANEQLQQEIAERRKVEEALRRSENTYRTVFESTGTATVIVEEDATITLANARFERLSGNAKEEIEGKKKWTEYVTADELSRMKEYHRLRRTPGESAPEQYEFLFVDVRGGTRHVLTNVRLIPETKKSVASYTDITDRKRMEEELARARQLESIGIMAGGIAHDFNNLLGVILGNLSLSEMYLQTGEDTRDLLKESRTASLRARDLVQQLLTFARGGDPQRKIEFIPALIRDSVQLGLAGSNVTPRFIVEEGLCPVECDAVQIQRAVMNLVVNARDAMPQGGTVEVRAVAESVGPDQIAHLKAGEYVRVSISDHGTGISPENLSKIFNPYFSTKMRGVQKGMGMGLTMTYSIIKRHGGHIVVESQQGVGTTFHVYLPAHSPLAEKPAGISGEKEVPESVRAKGRILFMDDEEMFRRIGFQMLAFMGYEVETAADGAEAVERFRAAAEAGKPFDAAVFDLTVRGGMGGKEALGKLRELDRDVRVVVSSGYSDDPVLANFEDYGFCAAISKPYEMIDLEQALHKAMV